MKPVVAFLISYHHDDEHADRHGNRQSEYIDKRKGFIPQHVAKAYLKIIQQHRVFDLDHGIDSIHAKLISSENQHFLFAEKTKSSNRSKSVSKEPFRVTNYVCF